jgi:hypothetical protein
MLGMLQRRSQRGQHTIGLRKVQSLPIQGYLSPASGVSKACLQRLFIDVTNRGAEEVIELLTEVQCIVTAQPPKSVLTLSDLTGAQFSRAAITRMKEVAVFDRPYVKRAALVGAQSLPRVYFEALKTFSQRGFRGFKTREEAMDWLVSEEAS